MQGEAVELVQKVVAENRRACVLVNNRSEGNAPLTIQALMKALQGVSSDHSSSLSSLCPSAENYEGFFSSTVMSPHFEI